MAIDLLPYILAWSQDGDQVEEFQQNGHEILEVGVASITKTITNWVARKWLTTDELLDTTKTLSSGAGPRFYKGDIVSIRDLMYAAAVPSDNIAPPQIGDFVGQVILDSRGEAGDPRQTFLDEMDVEMAALGYEGLINHGTVSNAEMSAWMVSDLFYRSMQDPVLRAMYSAMEHDAYVVGGPNPRTVHMVHTLRASPVYLPGVFACKTGSIRGRTHVVVAWKHPDNSEHITTVLNAGPSSTNERWYELKKILDELGQFDPGLNPKISDFNARYEGLTIEDFNLTWQESAEEMYNTQTFGNAVGARILEEDAFYRIENASYSPSTLSFTGTMDTTIYDFNGVWEGATVADFDSQFLRLQIRDFNTIPLRRD